MNTVRPTLQRGGTVPQSTQDPGTNTDVVLNELSLADINIGEHWPIRIRHPNRHPGNVDLNGISVLGHA